MVTILLVLGNIFYGFLSIGCIFVLFFDGYQTVSEFMVLLFIIFVFGGLFFTALIETVKNLRKGVWR